MRIICLFRSDLERIDNIIKNSFKVIGVDDKVNSSHDSFGYMSVHYTCMMKPEFSGPRYTKIKEISFEIQVRTISMHAWAVISHYLDYKSEWDVPAHLKKSLNALSGLFYVADSEFESFYIESQKSKELAASDRKKSPVNKREINLDTISAFLAAKFPDRDPASPKIVSLLVGEIIIAEYRYIEDIDQDIDKASVALTHFEKENLPTDQRYGQVAAARIALAIASDKYLQARKDAVGRSAETYKKYRRYISSESND